MRGNIVVCCLRGSPFLFKWRGRPSEDGNPWAEEETVGVRHDALPFPSFPPSLRPLHTPVSGDRVREPCRRSRINFGRLFH